MNQNETGMIEGTSNTGDSDPQNLLRKNTKIKTEGAVARVVTKSAEADPWTDMNEEKETDHTRNRDRDNPRGKNADTVSKMTVLLSRERLIKRDRETQVGAVIQAMLFHRASRATDLCE